MSIVLTFKLCFVCSLLYSSCDSALGPRLEIFFFVGIIIVALLYMQFVMVLLVFITNIGFIIVIVITKGLKINWNRMCNQNKMRNLVRMRHSTRFEFVYGIAPFFLFKFSALW